MKICLAWIYFFFLSLRDGNAEIPVLTAQEGGNITHGCSFFFSGDRKLFCKEECDKGVLVNTTEDRAQRGRYSVEYRKAPGLLSSSVLNVSITQLTKSDRGLYRCSLVRKYFKDSSEDFEIRVVSAPVNSIPNRIPGPLSPSVTSASTLATTQSLSSSSGSSTPLSASSEATEQSEQQHMTSAAGPVGQHCMNTTSKPTSDPPTTGALLYLGLTAVVLIIALSAAVLTFCRKRARKPKEPPEETEYVNVTVADREYEEIRERSRQSRPPPVEISTVYAFAKYTKPNAAESTDGYEFATAASSQKETEDNSTQLTYTALDFSSHTAALLSSAPCGKADITYSQVNASSDRSHTEDSSAPLYSTVTLH